MTHPDFPGLMTQKRLLLELGELLLSKYFFAALIGSDEYIYNYYVLPKESGVYRMGYTVEKLFF